MSEQEVDLANAEKVRAEARKITAEAAKIEIEAAREKRWWLGPMVKYAVAGVATVASLTVLLPNVYVPLRAAAEAKKEVAEIQAELAEKALIRVRAELKSQIDEAGEQARDSKKLVEELTANFVDSMDDEQKAVFNDKLAQFGELARRLESLNSEVRLATGTAIREGDPRGWLYVGHFHRGEWQDGPNLNVGKSLPAEDTLYSTTGLVHLRSTFPKRPFFSLPSRKGTLGPGEKVKVIQVRDDVGLQKVWALVEVQAGLP